MGRRPRKHNQLKPLSFRGVLSDKRSNEISEFVVDQTIEREGFWSEETADFPRK